jgi:hypothetical protein
MDVLMVSSLIGHSLDLLETDRRTILVARLFSLLSAINLHFEEICHSCDDAKIARCARNEAFNPFVDFPASALSNCAQGT